MLQPDFYLLGRTDAERERLTAQAQLLTTEVQRLMARMDVPPGGRALDLACGPRGALSELATCVGPRGTVLGLEKSPDFVKAAQITAIAEGLINVEVVEGDARATKLPRGAFDLVFARLILVNVPEPEEIVDEMVSLVKPGGIVVSYEADLHTHLCDPPSPAWSRLAEIYKAYSSSHGVDLSIGRRTHRMLHERGIMDLQVTPIVYAFPHAHPRRTLLLDFLENARAPIIAEGFATQAELARLVEELRDDLDDPGRLVVSHLFYEVWGRKP